jgi:hypothetical protein
VQPLLSAFQALRGISGDATMTIEALVGFGFPILPRPGSFLCTLDYEPAKPVHKKHNTHQNMTTSLVLPNALFTELRCMHLLPEKVPRPAIDHVGCDNRASYRRGHEY